jgi:hypothetical protein
LGNLLTSINPAYDVLTAVCELDEGGKRLISQIRFQIGSQSAKLGFLILDEDDEGAITALLEEMIKTAGTWGALNVTCELESDALFYEAFRHADFNAWAKQKLWRFKRVPREYKAEKFQWRVWHSDDARAMRGLYNAVIPKLFHNLEPLSLRAMLGMVYYNAEGVLQAYADMVYGPRGIWMLPIIHPTTADKIEVLLGLLSGLPFPGKRPIYMCVRSYQPWLEGVLGRMDAEVSPEQVLMVKHLAIKQKVSNKLEVRSLENGHADTGLPVVHFEQKDVH